MPLLTHTPKVCVIVLPSALKLNAKLASPLKFAVGVKRAVCPSGSKVTLPFTALLSV